ncbi:MAG: malate synthase A, partial [Microbacterium sp.]
MTNDTSDDSIRITRAPRIDGYDDILSTEALAFVAGLHRRFDERRRELLTARAERRDKIAAGGTLDFLPETTAIRAADWQVAPAPSALQDRRVEITGPAAPPK